MLTRALAIADYDGSRVKPDRLTRQTHAPYLGYATRMLEVYRTGIGRTRQELHRAIRAVFAQEPNCLLRRIDAFAKLLDDVSTFAHDRRSRAASLRRQVFRLAAPLHPLVSDPDDLFPNTEIEAKAQVAAQLGCRWPEIDAALFADIKDFQRLESFAGYPDAAALLARYNVAQVQTALFDAVTLVIWATDDFKTIIRHAKLAGLMHTIQSHGPNSYAIRLDGPASVLRTTRRYGARVARFLPALLACKGWRLHATLRRGPRGWDMGLGLSAADGLTSHLPPPRQFDSRVEEEFVESWGLGKRDGWTLVREGAVLHQGQKVFIPDFVFRNDDGRVVCLEVVGFWTPEYLEAKAKTLQAFSGQRILLAVGPSAGKKWSDLPPTTIQYKTRLRVMDVIERLRAFTS
jgi:predicted nuclease of restriction endonuclease-like RecB superfamily